MYWIAVFSCLFYFNISSGYSWIFSNFWSCIAGCYFTRWCWIENLVVPEVKSCLQDFVFQFLSLSYWNLFGPSPYITACIHHQPRILESLISLLQLKLFKTDKCRWNSELNCKINGHCANENVNSPFWRYF